MIKKDLAARLNRHDEAALAEAIDEFTPIISAIAYNISSGKLSRADIEEIASDVFVTLWKNSGKLRNDSLAGYICCIAKSRTKDRLRREHFTDMSDIDELQEADDFIVEENYEDKELAMTLNDEVKKLKEPDREIIVRFYYYYESVGTISQQLGIKADTVKSRLKRAREKLRKALTDRGY